MRPSETKNICLSKFRKKNFLLFNYLTSTGPHRYWIVIVAANSLGFRIHSGYLRPGKQTNEHSIPIGLGLEFSSAHDLETLDRLQK